LNEGLSNAGFDVFDTTGALFVWAGIPSGWDTDDFARALLEHTGVAVMPGTCFGEGGRGYVRLSLLESEENLRAAAQRFVSSDELRTILGS
jgi:aspartate/methionine/tyrosine aminotransferase